MPGETVLPALPMPFPGDGPQPYEIRKESE